MANSDQSQKESTTKGNSRDSLLVIYILHILKKYSSPKKHLSSQDVMDYLRKDYSIGDFENADAQRKKIRRLLDTLYESYSGRCIKKVEGKTKKAHKWFYDISRDKFADEEVVTQETLSETDVDILVDLVLATKILNSEGTRGLIDKLLKKTSISKEDRERRLASIQKEEWFKTPNEDLAEKKELIEEYFYDGYLTFDYEEENSITAIPLGWSCDDGVCVLNAKVGDENRKFSLDKIRVCASGVDGCEETEDFRRYDEITDSDKTALDSLFVNIPTIKNAIADRKSIRFMYRSYALDKGQVIPADKEKSVLPHSLVFNDGKYYLIGIDEDSAELNKVAYFRVDLMFEVYSAGPKTKLSNWDKHIFDTIERARVVEKHPLMLVGKETTVTFKVVESALDRVVDAFAVKSDDFTVTKETRMVKDSSDEGFHGEKVVEVNVTTTEEEAFRWALANAEVVETTHQDIRDKIARIADPIHQLYTQTLSDKVRENIDYIVKEGRFKVSNSVDENTARATFEELKRRNLLGVVDKIYLAKDDFEIEDYVGFFTNTKDLRVCHSPQCENLSWASNFTKLETLHLTETKVSDISWLKYMSKLKWLEIYDSPIDDLLILRDHSDIYTLRLWKTNIKDISFIENYHNLDWLTLIDCPIEDYSLLYRMPSYLKCLEIDKRAAQLIDIEKLKERYIGIDIITD